MRSQLFTARAAALFASGLPAGSRPSAHIVDAAIAGAVRQCGGTRGCVAQMAAAYGDYPETAAQRTVSRVSWNFGGDPCELYAATPTVSAGAAVAGWACRYSAATRWGICL